MAANNCIYFIRTKPAADNSIYLSVSQVATFMKPKRYIFLFKQAKHCNWAPIQL